MFGRTKGLNQNKLRQVIFDEITKERYLQNKKHPIWPTGNGDRLAILTEEVGEVAKGIQEKDLDNLRYELIQVAAVAVRWIEVLDSTPRRNTYQR